MLTTPVVRALKKQLKDVEIHYYTKRSFESVISLNPHIDKLHLIDESIDENIDELKAEEFDWIIDLHNNIRTKALKTKLKRPSRSFRKLNIKKWMYVRLKMNRMPDVHIVERYMETVRHLGVESDGEACDFPIEKEVDTMKVFGLEPKSYTAVVVGAKFKTKQIPIEKMRDIIASIGGPTVLIGGPDDQEIGKVLSAEFGQAHNACGSYDLQGSASIVKQSKRVISSDTGMMHIASCYDVRIDSVWGNTVPEFGMYPYRPNKSDSYTIHEVKGLSCRPCSKIGYNHCPKGHFKCMSEQNFQFEE